MKVAIAQIEPVPGSVEASLDKALAACAEAAHEGAKLMVFGEMWLPGYPMTLDVTGHYARPDVFSFEVKRERDNR